MIKRNDKNQHIKASPHRKSFSHEKAMKIHATLDILHHHQFSSWTLYLLSSELQIPLHRTGSFLVRRWKCNNYMGYFPACMSKGVVKH
jgi:hypothetical protein